MAIVQCPNHHYYDDRRDAECPYCVHIQTEEYELEGINEQVTVYAEPPAIDLEEKLTEAYGDYVGDYERTISVYLEENANRLTVGWLVCMAGSDRGRSQVIFSGRNLAGRDPMMDIVLPCENGLTEENHFSVVYEPKSMTFYLVAGTGETRLNGRPIIAEAVMVEGDEIEVGQTKYVFVPFCKEGRDWK